MKTLAALALIAPAPLFADAPSVTTDIAPVHSLVSQVMQGVGTPDLLMPQGADPHDFQMRPSQMGQLSDADLVFWVGDSLTPWLARALRAAGPGADIPLLDQKGTLLREAGHAHAEHDEHDEHDDDHSNHNTPDPHAWLSPVNGQAWLKIIADSLALADPEHADIYRRNASDAHENLEQLDLKIANLLAPVSPKAFILYHDAIGYFTDHYGLSPVATVREGDAAQPSAARMTEINDLLASGQVRCIFAEPQEGQKLVTELATLHGVGSGTLDPAGGQIALGPDLYATLLWNEAESLERCLSEN